MKNILTSFVLMLLGGLLATISMGDNMGNLIKVSTMQVDTVYCTRTEQVKFDTDTIRVQRKDKLVIVTGRKQKKEEFNVDKSEWIDTCLLTIPNNIRYEGIFGIYIEYDCFTINYLSESMIHMKDRNWDYILINPTNRGVDNRVSPETWNNIKVICKRYKP